MGGVGRTGRLVGGGAVGTGCATAGFTPAISPGKSARIHLEFLPKLRLNRHHIPIPPDQKVFGFAERTIFNP